MENVKDFDDFLNESKKSETKKSIDRMTAKIKGLRKDKTLLKNRQKIEINFTGFVRFFVPCFLLVKVLQSDSFIS